MDREIWREDVYTGISDYLRSRVFARSGLWVEMCWLIKADATDPHAP